MNEYKEGEDVKMDNDESGGWLGVKGPDASKPAPVSTVWEWMEAKMTAHRHSQKAAVKEENSDAVLPRSPGQGSQLKRWLTFMWEMQPQCACGMGSPHTHAQTHAHTHTHTHKRTHAANSAVQPVVTVVSWEVEVRRLIWSNPAPSLAWWR